jgi:hypothetical protein
MYQSTIGKIFLDAYNRREGTSYTGRSFFEKKFVPLFFAHPKYMMTNKNSPLTNPSQKKLEKEEKIRLTIQKIECGGTDASIAIGYSAVGETRATASMTTNRIIPIDKEKVYLSWIGAGLGISVKGDITILFNYAPILLDIFDGWEYYRKYLEEEMLALQGNQINEWNAQWIAYKYRQKKESVSKISPSFEIRKSGGIRLLSELPWVRVLLPIAIKYEKEKRIMGYLYNIDNENSTFGFILFQFEDIIRPKDFYTKIFGESSFQKSIETTEILWGEGIGLRAACRNGSIGVEALEPKGLKDYLPTKKEGKESKTIKYNGKAEQKTIFNTYIIWILAMLNNKNLWEQSQRFATIFSEYSRTDRDARTTKSKEIDTLLSSTSKRKFIDGIDSIIKGGGNAKELMQLAELVYSIPVYDFLYFVALLRLQYTYSELINIKNKT